MPTSTLGLEIPSFGASAALSAASLGATRIELNAQGSYSEGGLTPSIEDLKQFISSSQRCPLRIMIRPRGPPSVSSSTKPSEAGKRDFLYSNEEFEIMEASIKEFKDSDLLDSNKGDGFVFGILEEDEPEEDGSEESGSEDGGQRVREKPCWVDMMRCARLVQAAQPFTCVFHRAFDEVVSCDPRAYGESDAQPWEIALEAIAACRFTGVLTSGGLGKAIDNIEILEQVIQKAEALKIETIVGGGVRTTNVGEIIRKLGLRERTGSVYLHSACLRQNAEEDINAEEVQGILDQLN